MLIPLFFGVLKLFTTFVLQTNSRESVSLITTANLQNSNEYENKRLYSYVLEKGRGLLLI